MSEMEAVPSLTTIPSALMRAENEEKANEALEQAKKSVEALLQSVKK